MDGAKESEGLTELVEVGLLGALLELRLTSLLELADQLVVGGVAADLDLYSWYLVV